MNHFHEYLCGKLEEKLAKRRIVLFYDPRSAFAPFFDNELPRVGPRHNGLERVLIGERRVLFARYDDSFFGLRAAVEPVVAKDEPDFLILYLPGVEPGGETSVLMELEKGGLPYKPQLRRLARDALRPFYTESDIDAMVKSEALTYDDVVGCLEQAASGEKASILKTVLPTDSDQGLLVRWLADDGHDAGIVEKGAIGELYRLIEVRLGLSLAPPTPVGEARAQTARYLLVNEFRADLEGEPPTSLGMVPVSPSNGYDARIREVNSALRRQHPDFYMAFADRVEVDLDLAGSRIDPSCLGTTDTFRFEESSLLGRAIELAAAKQYDAALAIVVGRAHSFWLEHHIARRAQWEACRLAVELGHEVTRVAEALDGRVGDSTAWVNAYTTKGGWFEVDRRQRRLEAWLTLLDSEPAAEQAIAVVKRDHDELLKRMAAGFWSALADAGWTVPKVLHQTQVHPQIVQSGGPRVAYFLIDAMRYEMGVELGDQLQGVQELVVRPAVAALPTITSIGMAALLPGASAGFAVIDDKGKLAASVDGAALGDLAARLKYLKSRVPGLVDIKLEKVLDASVQKLSFAVEEAPLIVVRSQEIDLVGEMSDLVARNVMDTLIGNIARAVRRLASAGVESFVIAADHGHQFSRRREEDMRTDSPGGETIALHRRCWAGRGGATPPGTVRISGVDLGYDTDLDFIFPTGLGVFKASGSLSYHHGGASLQEIVVPVVSFRVPKATEAKSPQRAVQLADVPERLTNRTFGVRLAAIGDLLATESITVRVVLITGDRQVGQAGMVHGALFDDASGVITMQLGSEANVGIMLTVEDCRSVRVVVQDPATDAVLARSAEVPVRLGI
jgi:hypothetical protein